jgi:adenylyl cyclase-associated protein
VYLSEEAVSVTNFVTSKSTEMNVSWPDDKSGEQREAPIPEQFVHRLNRGAVTSEVSDLYH